MEFDCIISDIHCPVNAVFNLVLEKEDDLSNNTLHTRSEHVIKYKWKSDSAASFQSNVSDECIELILQTMDRAEAEGNITADVMSKVKLKLVLRNLGDVPYLTNRGIIQNVRKHVAIC